MVNIRLRLAQAMGDSTSLGIMAIALAALLWAIAATKAGELFQDGVSPFELAMSRAIIAALGLMLLDRLGDRDRPLFDWKIVPLGISLALVTACYYVAIQRLPVAVAIVIQYMSPVVVVAWLALRTGRKPSAALQTALVMAVAGVALISGVLGNRFTLDAIGLTAAVFSAVFYASYTMLSAMLVNTYGAIGTMGRAFCIAGVIWLAVQLTQGYPAALFTPDHVYGVIFVGIGGTLMPFSLFCWGIQQVSADRGAIIATLEPVAAAGMAWLWLGQVLNVSQMIGGALVLGAVMLLQRRS